MKSHFQLEHKGRIVPKPQLELRKNIDVRQEEDFFITPV